MNHSDPNSFKQLPNINYLQINIHNSEIFKMSVLKLSLDPKYKCPDCGKPYVKKGALTNHMRNVHAKNDSLPTQEFLDNTMNSDLDKDETIICMHAVEMTAGDIFEDVILNPFEDCSFDLTAATGPVSTTKVETNPVDFNEEIEFGASSTIRSIKQTQLEAMLDGIEAETPDGLLSGPLVDLEREVPGGGQQLQGGQETTAAPSNAADGRHQASPPKQQPERVTQESVFICGDCGKGFNTPHDVHDHMDKVHECMKCNLSTSALEIKSSELALANKRLTEVYRQIMGQAELVQKLYYRLEFKSKSKPKTPKVITIDDGNNTIECQLCNFKSSTEAEATKHVKEKHAHRCKKCLKEFKTKQELNNHVSTTHQPERAATQPPSAKICTNCREEFSSEKSFKDSCRYRAQIK